MRKKSVFRGALLLALLLSAAQGAIAQDGLALGISEGTSGGPELLTWLGGSS